MPFPRAWLRALIRLYPSQFRRYFGAEMLEVFDSRWAECRATPSLPARTVRTLRLLTFTSLNLMANAVKEHLSGSLESRPPHRPILDRVFRSHSRGDSMIRTTLRDLRLAARMLRRQPGFATVAVLTLSVGVGANAAIFSLVNGVLLREMPYPEPERLVTAWTSNVARGVDRWGVSLHDYTDWRERSDVFEDLAAWNQNTANLGGIDEPRRIAYAQVTPSLFTTLRTPPLHGRIFSPEENEPGQDGVIIVSRSFWERELGADPDALGWTLRLDGRPVTVVGVMPAGFAFPSPAVEVWKPFGMRPADEGTRGGRWVRAIARLERGTELETAQSSLSALASQLEEDFPETNRGFGIYIEPLMTTAVGGVSRTLYVFWGTAGLVLLIACGNLANLLLARSTGREREIGVRAALGASGGQIARQLLAESVPIAVLGGFGGSVVAFVSVGVLSRIGSGRIPRLEEVSVDT
ncbi:MAG: ABC transporter permease, partial [Gemmatimonadales bacterium]